MDTVGCLDNSPLASTGPLWNPESFECEGVYEASEKKESRSGLQSDES